MSSAFFLHCVGVIVGLTGLWYSSDRVVSICLVIARRFAVRTVVIGALFMALVTGLPELLLSIISVCNDAAQLSVGDIMGSNLIDTVVVIGTTALVTGDIHFGQTKRTQLLWLLAGVAATMGVIFAVEVITPAWGAGFILGYILFLSWMWSRRSSVSRTDPVEALHVEHDAQEQYQHQSIVYALGYLVLLALSTQVALYSGKELAIMYALPLEVLGATVFAVATSLPEFVISIHAARRGAHGLLLGNALGAALQQGLFTLGMLGICAREPITVAPVSHLIGYFSIGFMLLAVTFIRRRITPLTGGVLVMIGVVFVAHEYIRIAF